jgi:hypothetical protein
MKTTVIVFSILILLWVGSKNDFLFGKRDKNSSKETFLTDEQLLDTVQYRTLQYFWKGCEPNSGMAPERIHMNGVYPENDKDIIATGGSGFGIMAMLAAVERGFITRDQFFKRLEQIVIFLEKSERFHGAYPHWINGRTGKAKPFTPKDDGGDIVETAYLFQGLLAVKQYFLSGNVQEKSLARRIDLLWKSVDWKWYQNGKPVLFWHWSPKFKWEMNFPIRGYNECLIAYVLGASSPTHPISPDAYHKGWARGGEIRGHHEKYGYVLDLNHNDSEEYGGPLFWAHYSYLGLDPRKLKDQYADYWKNNVSQVMIDYHYCVENPLHFKGYGENCWGLTASYSIPDYQKVKGAKFKFPDDPDVGYEAHKPGLDHGVISPTAALSSFPYAPKEAVMACRNFYQNLGSKIMGEYGFYDAFSEEYGWYPKKYLAIDQGPIVVMIENYRSGLLWKLFMRDKDVQNGLKRLGFSYQIPDK